MSLRRDLGPRTAVLITVGAMIGSGIFWTPHDVALSVQSPTLTLLLWIAGGILALLGALSFAELGAAIPETGGLYVYLKRAYGPWAGFAFAWAMLIVLVPSSVGFFAQVTAHHLLPLLGLGTVWAPALAIGVVVALVIANLRGVRSGAAVQDAATAIKFAGILGLAVLGLVAAGVPVATQTPAVPADHWALMAALVPVLWAFDGWIDITSVAGEVQNPARNIPRSLGIGTLLVTALYLLANVAYLRILGPAGLAASATPAADAAAAYFGPSGSLVVSLLVAVSTLGGCAVALLTGTRVVYAVAADGLFFKSFARTSAAGVPDVAIAACGALAVVFLASPVGRLGDLFVIGAWPFYAFGALATLVLRRKEPDLPRPHRTIGYPLTNLLFAAASLAIVAGYAVTNPGHVAISAGLVALGLVIDAIRRRTLTKPGTGPI